MAIIRKLEKITLEKRSTHTEVDATFTIISETNANENEKFLQIDTYGSKQRKLQGKKSQTIRFTKAAIEQLKEIINSEF